MSTKRAALPIPLAEVLADLVDSYEVAGRAPSTCIAIARAVKGLTGSLGEANRPDDIRELDRTDIQQFLAKERRRGLAEASLSINQRSLRTFLKYAVENGFITKDPSDGIPLITVNARPVRFLDDEQYELLVATTGHDRTLTGRRDLALLLFLGDTGTRRAEVAGLRVADLDLDARTANVRAETSKVRRHKTVAYSARTSKALRAYLRARAEYFDRAGLIGDYLWVGSKRGPLTGSGLRQALRRRLSAARLPMTSVHSLRHRWAANATRKGMPLAFMLQLGGWTSPVMPTTLYGQFSVVPDSVAAAHAMMDGKGEP